MELSNKLNIIPIYFRNILFDTEQNKIKFILICVLVAACIAFLHGIIKEKVISPTSIVVMVISSTCSYLYIKQIYAKKYKYMKNKIKSLSKNSTLDDLCTKDNVGDNDYNKDICGKYISTKKNFYHINDLLLKQFKFIIKILYL